MSRRGSLDLGAAIAIAIALAAGVAHAQPGAPSMPMFAPSASELEDPPEPRADIVVKPASEPSGPNVTTYRPALVLASVTSLALVVTPLALDGDIPMEVAYPMIIAGDIGVFVSGAIVHLAHGEGKRAMASVGARMGLALVGFAVGAAIPCEEPEDDNQWHLISCHMNGAAVGAGAGLVSAVVLETIYMTKQTHERERPRVTPILSAAPGGGQVGLAGTF